MEIFDYFFKSKLQILLLTAQFIRFLDGSKTRKARIGRGERTKRTRPRPNVSLTKYCDRAYARLKRKKTRRYEQDKEGADWAQGAYKTYVTKPKRKPDAVLRRIYSFFLPVLFFQRLILHIIVVGEIAFFKSFLC